MFEKLAFIEEKYEELSKKIADPNVISMQSKLLTMQKRCLKTLPIKNLNRCFIRK